MGRISLKVWGLVLVLMVTACKLPKPEMSINEVVFLSHKLRFDVNVEKHRANFKDQGLMWVKKGANLFYLAPDTKIESFFVTGFEQAYKAVDMSVLERLNPDLAAKITVLDPPKDALWILFKQTMTKKTEFIICYSSEFQADISEIKFSKQNVGREVTATIQDEGAYFSPSSYYYPRGNDELMSFEVTATIPSHWESIADGNRVTREPGDSLNIQSWKNPYKSDGLMFMAAPFVVKRAIAGVTDVYCYFFEEDTSLFETYLPAAVDYINVYSNMIGPYPYERFTVAENFFPTGYGMPAWTLLGQQVIRLPFIVMTSLGHEVLHNWWGNSIYVDYEKGNWCEGLTVYGADYHYKLKQSPDLARDYRKDILKQYKSYVRAENEFPVREFRSRHNAESRTIGYNKTMMIFHMIEEQIGKKAFFQAWQDIYAKNKGKKVTWKKWITAYETSSGDTLDNIIPEWVDRVGAAQINVELLASEKLGDLTRVKFAINQPPEDVYTLNVPVRFIGGENQDTTIEASTASTIVELTLDSDVSAFELDPDYNIFRHLYPQEIEPIVAASLGAPEKHFVYSSETDRASLKAFGDNLTEGDINPTAINDSVSLGPEGSYAIFTINPEKIPSALSGQVKLDETSITINGNEYPREGHTFILSSEEAEISAKIIVIISDDHESLARVGQLTPHYGKYSYLVFKGTMNVGKGQWPALTSPLRVTL